MKIVKRSRRKFDSAFKPKVAIEALKERETLSVLAVSYDLHSNQISQWKQEFLENSSAVFEQKGSNSNQEPAIDIGKLYSKIGELEMEKDFLKKKFSKVGTMNDCIFFIEKEAVKSIRRQCDLLDITSSALYYQAKVDIVFLAK